MNYEELGLKVGLEIHRQLKTKHKLFCSCPPVLHSEEPHFTFLRRLRPTQSEVGQVDPAALFEFKRGRVILYEAYRDSTCLVETDEEPPHPLNPEALEIALTAALMMKSTPVDEVHVMRKVVIDGSNTTGFQRTCVVALGGEVIVGGKRVPIQHVGLEEDAARKTGEDGLTVRYRLDRLGIPLIEVATAPVIHSPKEAEEVALAIGRILKATGRVVRGLGAIRQDINISIRDGALIEVKGVQELPLVAKVVEYEVKRQLGLLEIRDELRRRGVKEEHITENFVDATQTFRKTKCKVIQRALKSGGVVLALKLAGFSGLLGKELMPGVRFGTELSDFAVRWSGVGGLFHTDELPAYGISQEEVDELRRLVGAGEGDAVVLVAGMRKEAEDALRAVVERCRMALHGVPEETRAARPDGTTRYMRPRPGAARMYPETDIPPIPITEEYIEELKARLPEMPEQKLERLMKTYGLNRKLASQLMDSEYLELFEEIAKTTKVPTTVVATTLTETLKSLRRDGVKVDAVSDEQILSIFRLVDSGSMAKEAIPDVITWLSEHPDANPEDALKALGLTMLSREELLKIVKKALEERESLVKERGQAAFGPLMGYVMAKVRGRADPKLVKELVKQELDRALGKS